MASNDPDDACPNLTGLVVDESGCSEANFDSDGDGVSDLGDACDDTPFGFPVLADGCTDESALDTDLDGDSYSGVYTDIDPVSGFHVNQTGDGNFERLHPMVRQGRLRRQPLTRQQRRRLSNRIWLVVH